MANGTIKFPAGMIVEEVVIVDNKTVGASNVNVTSKDVSKSGYVPIGIVGYRIDNATSGGTGASFCFPYYVYLAGSTANVNVRNMNASAAAVIKTVAFVLYIPN